MASIYDRTSNIYKSEFRNISLTNSGFFVLPDEDAKFVTIHNHQPVTTHSIDVAKISIPVPNPITYPWDVTHGTHNVDVWGASGTAYVTGISMVLEDGFSFKVNGISNANEVAIRKHTHNLGGDYQVQYVVER